MREVLEIGWPLLAILVACACAVYRPWWQVWRYDFPGMTNSYWLRGRQLRPGWYEWVPVRRVCAGLYAVRFDRQSMRLDDFGFVRVGHG